MADFMAEALEETGLGAHRRTTRGTKARGTKARGTKGMVCVRKKRTSAGLRCAKYAPRGATKVRRRRHRR